MLEVVVIGAGIAGFTVALALRQRDAAVTLVEAIRPGAEATGASAGMLAAQYESPGADAKFRLCLESRTRYPEYAAKLEKLSGRALHVRQDGMLVANLDDAEHAAAQETVRWQRDEGLNAEVVDPAAARKLQPGVNRDTVSYLWLPDERQLDSQALAEALVDALARTDVRLISGNGAAEILHSAGAVTGLRMADGRSLEADAVVLAAGAWSSTMNGLPRELPVRPMRGQMLRLPLEGLRLRAIVSSHAGRYLVPRDDGTVLAGSTMEDVGFDRSITDAGEQLIRESIVRLVPELGDRRPLEHWSGLRPISADSAPIIGPDPELQGLFYATGYGRDGILVAPLAGDAVADLVVFGEAR
ncbi:MAG TPA: glycine oxidase ThiO, partial [Gemmatimonadota bacterium]|nr:glycine oxidase ThiO [Gemmatimonadota bacterium]